MLINKFKKNNVISENNTKSAIITLQRDSHKILTSYEEYVNSNDDYKKVHFKSYMDEQIRNGDKILCPLTGMDLVIYIALPNRTERAERINKQMVKENLQKYFTEVLEYFD